MADVKRYVRETRRYAGFKKITFKWSDGTGNEFPRLRVVVKDAGRARNTQGRNACRAAEVELAGRLVEGPDLAPIYALPDVVGVRTGEAGHAKGGAEGLGCHSHQGPGTE